ncbi:hypothetical protein KL86DES1_21496 [uncultured Desulfovibrio sp.]|uniref:Uncharacterized protein n=1 Tax=uncultured Desulfovibrio sp. TaxID=167968 RepID=A0A212L880_9BACT|nr:hypothetical protein KL86DES1_21496 [uncultured Desulfovibrio sp.]VZH34395.1 conserved protein of unknown function [Desulfovibrio sp. 86]
MASRGQGRRIGLSLLRREQAVKCLVGEGPSLNQTNFEMFYISKLSFSRKCDLRLNPRHVVARCTLVQR